MEVSCGVGPGTAVSDMGAVREKNRGCCLPGKGGDQLAVEESVVELKKPRAHKWPRAKWELPRSRRIPGLVRTQPLM